MRRVAAQVVFTTHTPVPAGHDRFTPALVEEHLGPLREALGVDRERFLGLGRVNPYGRRRDVLHDGAGAEVVPPRQRRLVAARPGLARDVEPALSRSAARTACRSATSPTASTCRPGWRRRCGRSTTVTSGPTGRARASDAALWERIDAIDDGELWETHQTLKVQLIETVRRRAAQQAERRGEPADARRAAPPGAQLRRADDRLRAPLRHLQARHADAARHRGVRRARQQPDDADSVRLRRQVASARRPGQGRAARDRAAAARPALRRQARLRRGLRHQRRPAPRAGRRRLAQQPAAAARGLRHQRPEGRAQRRLEPVDPRRLVGGGVRRPERLRHRHGRDALVDRRPRRARRRLAPRRPARRRRPALLRPRSRRPAARVDRADEARDPHARLALQRRPHGDGLRAARPTFPAAGGTSSDVSRT